MKFAKDSGYEIIEIDNIDQSPQAAGSILLGTTDDIKVVSVKVKFEKANGSLAEKGSATLSSYGLLWLYNATTTGTITGNMIWVTATVMPGLHC